MSTNELWRNQESPLWLLQLSRSCAQYPGPQSIAYEHVTEYVDQFSADGIASIKSSALLAQIHPGHREFFGMLAEEAAAYHQVFHAANDHGFDDYTSELIAQVKEAFGEKSVTGLSWHSVDSKVAGNLMILVAMAAIRDMALIEDLHRRGELDSNTRKFGLEEIQHRMDRIGINGINSLFAAQPKLEEFIENDTRLIDVGHMPGFRRGDTKTRAASYNVEQLKLDAALSDDLLTNLRQMVISSDFSEIESRKNHYIIVHVNDVPEPSAAVRQRYADYGVRNNPEVEMAFLRGLEKIRKDPSPKTYNEYMHFLIHDGIAVRHPQRQTFAAELHKRASQIIDVSAHEIVDDPQKTLPASPPSLPGPETPTEEKVIDSSTPPPGPEAETPKTDESAPGKNADKSPSGEKTSGSGKEKSTSLTTTTGSSQDSTGSDKAQDAPKDTGSTQKPGTAAKVATIAGAATMAGLLLSERGKDKGNGKNETGDEEHRTSTGKIIAFAAATTVAVGGAILWSRKPEFLYKPLQKFFALFGDQAGKGIS